MWLGLGISIVTPQSSLNSGGEPAPEALPVVLSSDSIWNNEIPSSPTIKSNSADIVTKLISWNSGVPSAFAASVHGTADDFNVPVYYADVADPLYTIDATGSLDAREFQIEGMQIRLPAAAVPAGGSDAHLVVVDENEEWVYEFWDVASLTSSTITAAAAGRFRFSGDGFDVSNAFASKTAAIAGRITTEEWIAAANGEIEDFGHAIAIMVRSTDGTTVWPSYGLASATDTVNAPPDGTWFQYNDTLENIDAESIDDAGKAFLRTARKYGMIVMDTTGGTGSWNVRSLGNDTADDAILADTPMTDHAVAVGSGGGWNESSGVYYYGGIHTGSGVDWASNLRVLDPTYMQGLYETRIAYKKLDPIADVENTGPWGITGASTVWEGLTEATYAPFDAGTTPRIGTNTAGRICSVRVETLTVPEGKTLKALTLWYNGNTATATTFTARLKSGTTVLGSYAQPANENYGWRSITYVTNGGDVDLEDIRIEFELVSGTNFSNIRAAHVMAEFTT